MICPTVSAPMGPIGPIGPMAPPVCGPYCSI
jgi:hypothetical protein